MTKQTTLLLALSLAISTFGCGGGDDGGGGATTGCTSMPVTTTPQPMECKSATVVANEASNYRFSSEIRLPPTTVKSMTNLKFDWGAVTRDFQGHPVSPMNDIDTMVLFLWRLPLAELESKLNADTLFQSDLEVSPPPSWPNTANATTLNLYDFTVNGTAVTPDMFNMFFDPALYPPSTFTYMVGAQTGTELGQGSRMLQTFNLDASSSSTTVALKNESTRLTCAVSLRNLTITGVPGETPNLMLDWGQMQTNAMGAEFLQGAITRAVVGHYSETPEQLESKFLDLELIAQKYYTAEVTQGSVLDFTTLRDSTGAAFPGVDGTGTWMVGLFCGNCRNPAPWYMTVLKPCSGT